MTEKPMTIPEVARRLGTNPRHVVRLYERGFLPHPPRVGSARVVREDELPAIEAALRKAGYPVVGLAEQQAVA